MASQGSRAPEAAKEVQSCKRTSWAESDGDTEHRQEVKEVMKF